MIRVRHDLSLRWAVLPALASFALLTLAAPGFAQPIEVDVRLTLPAGAETTIESAVGLPVLAVAEPNLPVKKSAVLAQLDKEDLERELDATRKQLASAQAEKRRLAVDRGATSSSPSSNDRTALRNAQEVSTAESAEQQALSEITTLTTRIAQSLVRAPEDGYLVKSLYQVGAKTKKRKPFLIFAEASRVLVEAKVPAAQAAPFTPGATVRLSSTAGDGRTFQAKVLAATPEGDSVTLKLQPLELPLFPLGSTNRLALSPAS